MAAGAGEKPGIEHRRISGNFDSSALYLPMSSLVCKTLAFAFFLFFFSVCIMHW